jgi:hypothetical protein
MNALPLREYHSDRCIDQRFAAEPSLQERTRHTSELALPAAANIEHIARHLSDVWSL